MKTNWMRLGLGALVALLAGCVSPKTLPVVTGAAVQFTACQLAKARPAAKAPLHAAGVTLKAFGSDTPPTQAVLQAALAAMPKADAVTQVEINAMWAVVTAAYGELYVVLETPEQKATLQLWFTRVGEALDSGSTCGADPAARMAKAANAQVSGPTWEDLGRELKASLPKGGR